MLRELVTLWPGGPAMTFASYFIIFKYVFTVAFLCWAIGILRWPNRWWLFGGSLLLAALAWTVLELPLGRPYGVVEGEQGLSALAQPMVAAARGTAADGWMVHQPNPQPLWSLVLAFASGFDPGWLFSFYDFIPLVGMIFLASAVFWFMGAFDDEESTGLARGFSVFFVLFLSSTRLSFLETPGPFWLDVFGQRPHLAFALGLLVIWFKLLGGARRLPSFLGAGALLGLIAWMEPRVAAPAVLGAITWVVVSRGISTTGWKTGVTLTVGALLFLPWSKALEPAGVPLETGALYFAFDHFLGLTMDKGLVFYLAVFALVRMVRGGRATEVLFVSQVGTVLVLATVSFLTPSIASWTDIRIVGATLNLLLAMAAGRGACCLVEWLEQSLGSGSIGTRYFKNVSLHALGMTAVVVFSLPWAFPYWWHPVLMDPVYVRSVEPIAPQFSPLVSWIGTETEPDAVFVAGPSYSSWIPALSGRRVLIVERAVIPPSDLDERRQAESWFAESEDPARIRGAASRWSLTHLAGGRLDKDAQLQVDHTFFEESRDFSLVWQQGRWIRVFKYQR